MATHGICQWCWERELANVGSPWAPLDDARTVPDDEPADPEPRGRGSR
jgi:hypothetical protein